MFRYILLQIDKVNVNFLTQVATCWTLVRFGALLYGLVQFGTDWYRLVRFGTIWYCKVHLQTGTV